MGNPKKTQHTGILHGAFYQQPTGHPTKNIHFGRSLNAIMEPFKYSRDQDGKIIISRREC